MSTSRPDSPFGKIGPGAAAPPPPATPMVPVYEASPPPPPTAGPGPHAPAAAAVPVAAWDTSVNRSLLPFLISGEHVEMAFNGKEGQLVLTDQRVLGRTRESFLGFTVSHSRRVFRLSGVDEVALAMRWSLLGRRRAIAVSSRSGSVAFRLKRSERSAAEAFAVAVGARLG